VNGVNQIRRLHCALAIVVVALFLCRNAQADDSPSTIQGLDITDCAVEPETSVPAGLPIILWFSVRNESAGVVSLLLTGPGRYLEGNQFIVRAVAANGNATTRPTANGQFTQGALHTVTLAPLQSLRTPLMIEALDPGTYDAELLFIGSPWHRMGRPVVGQSLARFKLTVTQVDDAGKQAWIEQRLAEVRDGDPFAAYVTRKIPQIAHALLDDLSSNDPARVSVAAAQLKRQYTGQREWADAIFAGLDRASTRPVQESNEWDDASAKLIDLVAPSLSVSPDERFLVPILELSRTGGFRTLDSAGMALQSFDQPAASERLLEWANDAQSPNRWIAAEALVSRGDERGIPALADLALADDSRRSGGRPEFDLLVLYPDVKAAVDAVEKGRTSANGDIASSVERALHPSGAGFVDPLMRSHPPKAITDLTTQDAMTLLLKTDGFVLLSNANAADPPMQAVAVRLLQTSGGASHLLQRGTSAGKLYALCILYFRGKSDRLAQFAADLSAQNDTVTVVDGDQRTVMPMKDAVARVMSGEYAQRLMRSYPAPSAVAP
jgi:hypothetical protein